MPTQANTTGTQKQIADTIFEGVFEKSHDFRIEMPFDMACQFIRRIDSYNEFDSLTVLDALGRVDRLIPRIQYGDNNPNNWQRDYKISVGREGSPVLYIERYEWGWNQSPLAQQAMADICHGMKAVGKADEVTCMVEDTGTNGRKLTFRFWWD